MNKKESRTAILYARIKPSTIKWLDGEKKRLKYKSQSEFLDDHFSALKSKKKSPLDSKSA